MTKNKLILKEIPGFTRYLAGSDGIVYSTIPWRGKPVPRGLKSWYKANKYLHLHMINDLEQTKEIPEHRVIALAFHGECPKGMQCRHLDGDRGNNRPDNLSWGTAKQNCEDREKHGNWIPGPAFISNQRFTKKDILSIRKMYATGKLLQREIAKIYNTNQAHISAIVRREHWSHIQ